jgi:cephalosporin hydroxylase
MVVDFGTWCGALALLFYQLASEYNVPTVISVDISGQALEKYRIFHVKHQTDKYIRFLIGHSLSQTILDAITVAIEEHKRRRLGRILLSFDDDHTFPHTFHELIAYARLLGPGDVILMQDTWDQGLKPYPFSPMYSVFKFLSEDRQWTLDYEFLRNIELPCNFIHGVLIRRAPLQ